MLYAQCECLRHDMTTDAAMRYDPGTEGRSCVG